MDGLGRDYLQIARTMAHDWRAGLQEERQAGLPALILGMEALIGHWLPGDEPIQWQRAGQVVSLLGGIACIPLSRRVGLLAAWIWALLPDACRFSADVLTDMPYLALTLGSLALAMVGLHARSRRSLFQAGFLAGAGYIIRAEAASVVVVTAGLAILQRAASLRWRWTAPAVLVAGFTLLGAPYIWLENGEVFSEKPGLLRIPIPRHADLETPEPVSASAVPSFPVPPSDPSLPMLAQAGATRTGWKLAEALVHFAAKLSDSLNGVWLALGALYLVLPGKRRLRRNWLPLPLTLWILHSATCLWLYMKFGYLSRRHVMLLDVGIVILAAGTLAYTADRLARHAQGTRRRLARRTDRLAMAVIILALTPWLLRDINDERGYIRDAARWVQVESRNRQALTVFDQYGWVSYYAGLTDWIEHRDPRRFGQEHGCQKPALAIVDLRDAQPERIETGWPTPVRVTEAARFTDATGRRGMVIYYIAPAASASSGPTPTSAAAPASP